MKIITHEENFKKDTVYRFLNSPNTIWDKFVLSTAKNIIVEINSLTSDEIISLVQYN